MFRASAGAIGIAIMGVPTAHAQDAPASNPADAIAACRSIASPTERLACFDKAAEALEAARAKKDLVVLDRSDVKKTRRSLFGFTLPRLKFLEGDGKEEAETEIATTIESARALGYGKWTLRTAEGAIWQTTEAMVDTPKAGAAVVIRRGALGSYMLKVERYKAVRAKRVN